jgi:hypothetical protein
MSAFDNISVEKKDTLVRVSVFMGKRQARFIGR